MSDELTPIQQAVERDVLQIILKEVENGKLSLSEAQASATMTLQSLATLTKDNQTIINFYEQLSRRFPVFELLYTKAKETQIKKEELAAYEQALKSVESGNIASARAIIDEALKKTAHEATNA